MASGVNQVFVVSF